MGLSLAEGQQLCEVRRAMTPAVTLSLPERENRLRGKGKKTAYISFFKM